MSSKSAKQQKALEQARSKLEDLTRKDVVSFSFILSEEGVELCGEEQLTVDMMNLLEESGMIEVAQTEVEFVHPVSAGGSVKFLPAV